MGRLVAVNFALIRDSGTFLGGLVLLGYEVIGVPEPRAIIIGVAVAMLGLPASLFADRTLTRNGKPKDSPP